MSVTTRDRPDDERRARVFSVRGLMALIAFLGIGLAVSRVNPASGIVLTFVLLAALLRTSEGMGRAQSHGRLLGRAGVVRLFLASIVVGGALLASSFIAFVASCYLLLWFIPINYVVAIVAAVVTFRSVKERIWPIRIRGDGASAST